MDGLAELGREWLANSPPATLAAVDGLAGWSGPVGFVCQSCASRLMARGCYLRRLADVPVWDDASKACALCE